MSRYGAFPASPARFAPSGSPSGSHASVTDDDVQPGHPARAGRYKPTTDCAVAGLRCEAANGSASCSDGVGCDPSAPAHCDGNRYFVTCDATTHLRSRVDCARDPIAGATCRIGGGFGDPAGCLPSGPPCARARCDGDVLVVCIAGEEVRADCTQLSSRCDSSSGKPACVPIATECAAGTKDQCSGLDLTTCVEGMVRAVDCAIIGLSACTLPPVGGDPICG